MESFFLTLKMELIHERRYEMRQQARAEIFEFIEVWYNSCYSTTMMSLPRLTTWA